MATKCVNCKAVVTDLESLEDGVCQSCRGPRQSVGHTCTCGIEVSKARRICAEIDCPWK